VRGVSEAKANELPSSLSGAGVNIGASSPAGAAPDDSTCAHNGIALRARTATRYFRACILSGHYDRIARHKAYVLIQVLALHHLGIVERQARMPTVGTLSQHID
jgi:hypothetical protein